MLYREGTRKFFVVESYAVPRNDYRMRYPEDRFALGEKRIVNSSSFEEDGLLLCGRVL